MSLSLLEYIIRDGMNCYNYALGIDMVGIVPYQEREFTSDYILKFNWVKLSPGHPLKLNPGSNPKNSRWSHVVDGCQEDGLIDVRHHFEQVRGMRTIALFSKDRCNNGTYADYHFTFFGNGQWHHKFPSALPVSIPRLLPRTIVTTSGNYKFDRYMLVPRSVNPMAFSFNKRASVKFYNSGKSINVVVIRNGDALFLNEPHWGNTEYDEYIASRVLDKVPNLILE